MNLVRQTRDESQNSGCVFFSLLFSLKSSSFSSHFFSLKFLTSIWAQSADRPQPSPTMYTRAHKPQNPGLPPRAGTEQSLAQISRVPEGVRARRHLGDHVTQEEHTWLSSRQECGIHEQKRVRPTAESTLHADSADATHLQRNITTQNCGIGVARAPNLLLLLRES